MSSAAPRPTVSGDATAQQSPAVTEAYARFALELKFEDIPADVVEIEREQILATIGSCSAVCHGTSGHQRSRAGGVAGALLCPGRGVITSICARSAATNTRSIGSVHP